MKKILLILFLFKSLFILGQFNYQSTLKDSNGDIIKDTSINFKIGIYYDNTNNSSVYEEVHNLNIPSDGIINIIVGDGSVLSGDFSSLDWSREIYVSREVDLTGTDSNYTDFGSTILNSIPKANYSEFTQGIYYSSNTVSITNLVVSNTITATAFVGDGSLLTNIESAISSATFLDDYGNVKVGTEYSNTISNTVAIGENALRNSNNLAKTSVAIGKSAMENAFMGDQYNEVYTDYAGTSIDESFEWNVAASVAIGFEAMKGSSTNTSSNTGSWNVAIGWRPLYSNTTGMFNTGVGGGSLQNNTSGNSNSGVGDFSLNKNTTGQRNTAFGASTAQKQVTANDIVAVGYRALFFNTSNGTVGIGSDALYANTTGVNNVAVGIKGLSRNVSGDSNTAIGSNAIANTVSATGNVAVGSGAIEDATWAFYNVALGDDALHQGAYLYNNIAIGRKALYKNGSTLSDDPITTGNVSSTRNIALGNNALTENILGDMNIAIGQDAMKKNQNGYQNVAIGDSALASNTIAVNNVAIGRMAMEQAESGAQNVSIGPWSLRYNGSNVSTPTFDSNGIWQNKEATSNIGIGAFALNLNNSGYQNVAIGRSALLNNVEGYENVGVGDRALKNNTTGNYNVGIGRHALENNNSENYNTALGYFAGENFNSSGNNNTFLGANSNTVSGTTLTNSTAIGANATVTSSNTIQLGDTNVTSVNTSASIKANDFLVGDESIVEVVTPYNDNIKYSVKDEIEMLRGMMEKVLTQLDGRSEFDVKATAYHKIDGSGSVEINSVINENQYISLSTNNQYAHSNEIFYHGDKVLFKIVPTQDGGSWNLDFDEIDTYLGVKDNRGRNYIFLDEEGGLSTSYINGKQLLDNGLQISGSGVSYFLCKIPSSSNFKFSITFN